MLRRWKVPKTVSHIRICTLFLTGPVRARRRLFYTFYGLTSSAFIETQTSLISNSTPLEMTNLLLYSLHGLASSELLKHRYHSQVIPSLTGGLRKAIISTIADDDVIQHPNSHYIACGCQLAGYFFIFRARRNIGAGVIVDANNWGGKFL